MKVFNLNVIVAVILLILVGCTAKNVMMERYSAKYDYQPQDRQAPNSQELTIALVSPKYVDNKLNTTPPFSNFSRNMEDDFEEMIIAKGFTIRGPFKSNDEMVYDDKLDTDIALLVDIDLQLEMEDLQTNAKTKMKIPIVGNYLGDPGTKYKLNGTFHQEGDITLTAISPFKGEKLWKKQISLDRKSINCTGEKEWDFKIKNILQAMKDNGVYNPTARALEDYYKEVMELAFNHLDPRELKKVAKQAKVADKDERN